ncbi:MIP/aquaporin family protein [Niabella beijingensis]|uniref:MIP/aquaporin family protein n=1 Tax=Niabella beijingensis TaxID=2872700 RepID=UPI001CC002F5|nr:MIP/aquaporin family protein [Niabella beijingensis]MBZ4187332.1 aquaporin family protein [Niabella beijingensis]
MKGSFNEFLGEAAGTFILVFLGCGAVGVSVLFNWPPNIVAIAVVWGAAVMIAIWTVRSVCAAHFNPAVSIAMAVTGKFHRRKLPLYFLAQFTGAAAAAFLLYSILGASIKTYETTHQLLRGAPESLATARMFGEFYRPYPVWQAMVAEGLGTFLLTAVIFIVTYERSGKKNGLRYAILYIGIALAILICLFAPVTQAGFNPARDFGPRLVAWFAGWGAAAFPDERGGFFWVYILAPLCGSVLAAVLYNFYIKQQLQARLKVTYETE